MLPLAILLLSGSLRLAELHPKPRRVEKRPDSPPDDREKESRE
tara:strand:- start:804 stop:932 length:129 start_codon:yes stop_codon:yes gene_type:complete